MASCLAAVCRPGLVGPGQASFAFDPSALLHLRASEFARVEPHDVSDLRVPSERPVTLKGIGWVVAWSGVCRPGPSSHYSRWEWHT